MSGGGFAWPRLAAEADAAEQAAQLLEQARQEGYDAGYKAGLAEARIESERLQQALRDSAQALDASFSYGQGARATQFCELSRSVLRALLDTELTACDQILESLIARALDALGEADPRPTIRVAESTLAWLPESWSGRPDVTIDARLADGVVRIDGGDTQFEFDPYHEISQLIAEAEERCDESARQRADRSIDNNAD